MNGKITVHSGITLFCNKDFLRHGRHMVDMVDIHVYLPMDKEDVLLIFFTVQKSQERNLSKPTNIPSLQIFQFLEFWSS